MWLRLSTHAAVLPTVHTLTGCSLSSVGYNLLWAVGLHPFSCGCVCGWSEMASAAAWSPGQSLLAACVNFMDYTQPGNKML